MNKLKGNHTTSLNCSLNFTSSIYCLW